MNDANFNQAEVLTSANLGSRAKTAVGWKVLSQGLTTGLQMVTGIILARLLMPQDFGILGMATMVTGLAGIFRDLGLGQALVQRQSIERTHLVSAYWGTMVMGALLTGLTILLAPYVGDFFKEPRMVPVLQVISFSFLISPFATIPNAMLQRDLDFKRPFYAAAVSSVAYAAVGITMAMQGYSYWSLVYALVASTMVMTVAICVLTRHLPPLIPCFRGIRDLYSFGIGQSGVGLFNYLAQQADYFVVGRWLDSATLGLYTRAFTLVHQPLGMVSGILSPVLFPMFAHLKDSPAQARAAMGRILMAVSLLTFPLLTLFGVAAPQLIPLVFGRQWEASILPAQILVFAGMLRTVINPSSMLPKAFGAVHSQVWRNGVYCISLVLLAIWGTRWGIVGVAWGVLLATFIAWLLNTHLLFLCSGFGLHDYLRSLRCGLLCSLLVLGTALPVRLTMITHASPAVTLIITLTVGLCAAAIFVRLAPFGECRSAMQSILGLLGSGSFRKTRES